MCKIECVPAIKRFISSELAFHACEESQIVYWKIQGERFHIVRNLFSPWCWCSQRKHRMPFHRFTIPNINGMWGWWVGGGAADMLGAKFGWPSFSISCRFRPQCVRISFKCNLTFCSVALQNTSFTLQDEQKGNADLFSSAGLTDWENGDISVVINYMRMD